MGFRPMVITIPSSSFMSSVVGGDHFVIVAVSVRGIFVFAFLYPFSVISCSVRCNKSKSKKKVKIFSRLSYQIRIWWYKCFMFIILYWNSCACFREHISNSIAVDCLLFHCHLCRSYSNWHRCHFSWCIFITDI